MQAPNNFKKLKPYLRMFSYSQEKIRREQIMKEKERLRNKSKLLGTNCKVDNVNKKFCLSKYQTQKWKKQVCICIGF